MNPYKYNLKALKSALFLFIIPFLLNECSPSINEKSDSDADLKIKPFNALRLVKVARVLDGDTFVSSSPGRPQEYIRIVGVNTPELDECYGIEAKQALLNLISDKEV